MKIKETSVSLRPDCSIALKDIVVLPLAWILGIVSLKFFRTIFPENFAFVSSLSGALLGIAILYLYFLKRLDSSLSLPVTLSFFFIKTIVIYFIWTTYVFYPAGRGEIGFSNDPFAFGDSFFIWDYMSKLGNWWHLNGFSVFPPREIPPINHPQAAVLCSLPFISLPLFSENLIPWNMLYMTILASSVYGIGRLEGFSISACRAAFYLVLIQPCGWDVMILYKDIQCQMFFGIFILAILFFRRKIIPLVITTVMGAYILHQYRVIYDLILVAAAIFVFVRGNGMMGTRFVSRILTSIIVCILAAIVFPAKTTTIINHIQYLLNYYAVGQTMKDNIWLWHVSEIKYSAWIFSLPDRFFISLMAPFPWTEIFKNEPFWKFSQLVWCLHTALMLVCFCVIALFGFRDLKKKMLLPAEVVFALIVATSGALNFSIHSGYVQIAMPLSFPYVLHKLGKKKMLDCFFMSVLFFMIASVFWNALR